jgi:hypothetical protein
MPNSISRTAAIPTANPLALNTLPAKPFVFIAYAEIPPISMKTRNFGEGGGYLAPSILPLE